MLHDPEFHAGQAYQGMPHGINPDFDAFCLYEGGIERGDRQLLLGRLPVEARSFLGWPTANIYGSWDFARKARFEHGMSLSLFRGVSMVIEKGDVYWEPFRGPGRTVIFTLRLNADQPYWFYLPCKLDKREGAIFAKTMWLGRMRRAKLKKLWPLLIRSELK